NVIPGESRAVPQFKAMAFEIAARYLFGDPKTLGLDLVTLSHDFDTWVAGMFSPFAVRVPGSKFSRAMAARKRLFDAIGQAVAVAARADRSGDDVMRTLLRVRDDNGDSFPHEVIVDELQLLMFAGHDTTVTSLTNLMFHLSQHQDVYTKVVAEQDGLAGQAMDAATVKRMAYLEQVINESMRVIPPIGGAFRRMTEDTEYGGFTIPKGWSVSVSPGGSHFDASVWTDPKRFDPERWSPDRAEHKRAPLAFIPFGGGPRVCLGQHFAMLEMKVVLALLIQGYRWRLVRGQNLGYNAIPFPRPKSGLRVLMQARG
ncbi:MAG: cytochrome P450, partial [Nannocystaceae bacterium]